MRLGVVKPMLLLSGAAILLLAAPQEAARLLGEAIDFAHQGRLSAARIR